MPRPQKKSAIRNPKFEMLQLRHPPLGTLNLVLSPQAPHCSLQTVQLKESGTETRRKFRPVRIGLSLRIKLETTILRRAGQWPLGD
jgi:hypothetical protein